MTTIIMPADAPALEYGKNTRDFGAEVVLYDREAARIARGHYEAELEGPHGCHTRAALRSPPGTIAGQGTTAIEMAEQAAAIDARFDVVLVPCSGGGFAGGLHAGAAPAPQTKVYAVEPALADDTRRSLASGRRQTNDSLNPSTICDALLSPTPGEITFALNQKLLAGALTVTDDEVLRAMALAFRHLKLVVEPGGATGLAAVLAGQVPHTTGVIGVVLSGGNVDARTFVPGRSSLRLRELRLGLTAA